MAEQLSYNIVRLNFLAPLHLGRGLSGQYDQGNDTIHSDTLKSALFVCALQLDSSLKDENNQTAFFNSFKVSSTFPYYEDVLFFPKPMGYQITSASNSDDLDAIKHRKKLKKIRFLDSGLFKKVLSGEGFNIHFSGGSNGTNIIDKQFISTHTIDEYVYTKHLLQKVVVPRIIGDGDAEPYHIEQLFFNPKAGLFFLIDFKEDSYRDLIYAALRLLGDHGVGMDRNNGYGYFEPKISDQTIDFPKVEYPNALLNLSLYCPTKDELQTQEKCESFKYELIKRGGYLTTYSEELSYRKKSVYMFKEGGIFGNQTNLEGKMVDLRPDGNIITHTVHRDGRSIFLPMKTQ